MPEHGQEQPLEILGRDEVAAVQDRPGARRLVERERAAHRRADLDTLDLSRRADERDDPALEDLGEVEALGAEGIEVSVPAPEPLA